MSNGSNDFIAQLERKAIQEGLQFIEELVFENGAVYKGKAVSKFNMARTQDTSRRA